jgi:ketosteroid isomerase-like protein
MGERPSELFRRFHRAWTDGDLPAVLDMVDPDVVVHPLHGVLYSRMEFRGRDGMATWYREMTEPYQRFEALVEYVGDTPDGATGIIKMVGHRDGQGLFARIGVVMGVRDGRVASLTARDVDDLEAELGISHNGR